MNDFDKILELELRRMLDPVAATKPPVRRGRTKRTPILVLAADPTTLELAAETIPVVESVIVVLPAPEPIS